MYMYMYILSHKHNLYKLIKYTINLMPKQN